MDNFNDYFQENYFEINRIQKLIGGFENYSVAYSDKKSIKRPGPKGRARKIFGTYKISDNFTDPFLNPK